jgi:5-methylcytosine-specific restriction endonuclease McrA
VSLSETLAVRDAELKMRTEKVCRMCLRPASIRPLTRHHLVPLRWFVRHPYWRIHRNATANILPLCRDCHDRVESSDRATREEARRHLRRSMTQQEVAYAVAVIGLVWLDQHYPLH